ncbi:hypothetical protein GP486_008247, partial [Trichoglossum hirsutum]
MGRHADEEHEVWSRAEAIAALRTIVVPKEEEKSPGVVSRPGPPKGSAIIITLDFYGKRHKPALTRLKEYICKQVKSDQPMTTIAELEVVHMPMPKDNQDCSVFFLHCVKELVQDPHKFVSKLILLHLGGISPWPPAKVETLRSEVTTLATTLFLEQTRFDSTESDSGGNPDIFRHDSPERSMESQDKTTNGSRHGSENGSSSGNGDHERGLLFRLPRRYSRKGYKHKCDRCARRFKRLEHLKRH